MQANDHIAKHIVEQKLTLVREILIDLANKFNFHFSLGFVLTKQNSGMITLNDVIANQSISIQALNMFLEPLAILRNEMEQKMLAINSGRIIVLCLNDREQDTRLVDQITVNHYYEVRHVHVKESKHFFILEGMDIGNSDGYESDRFCILLNHFNQN